MSEDGAGGASYHVTPPDVFSFSQPQDWPKWARRFERFRFASGLATRDEEIQVNTLIYYMGDEADDVLRSFRLSEEERKQYATVKQKFDNHFVKKRNVIYERAKFNMRKQESGESVDAFITDLYALAEYCEYGALHYEMIRDRLVVGLSDSRLSEKLQLIADLTLDKALVRVRQEESVKKQQSIIRGCEHGGEGPVISPAIAAVQGERYKPQKARQRWKSKVGSISCAWCGLSPDHDRQRCPARDAECRRCGRKGHYERVCRSAARVGNLELDSEVDGAAFLGGVSMQEHHPWSIDLRLNGHSVKFRIDTGADVTVVPATLLKQVGEVEIQPSDRTLRGPSRTVLPTKGKFVAKLQSTNHETHEEIFVVDGLHYPLLGSPAIKAHQLVKFVSAITKLDVEAEFPELFQGLGLMEKEYTIELREGAKPFALSTPCRVAIPLMPAVQKELARMEQIGVISKLAEPTEWCAGMVVVPKADGRVRICVDLTRLNESVRRERLQMPSVEETLAHISGAKVFSKLDANSGFWQVPLSKKSARLTTFITPFGRYHFNRLPFGITSAPEHFQRRMQSILEGVEGVQCHIDDILVYGKDQEEHDARLRESLCRLREARVTLNREKCIFSATSVKFLGQVLSAAGVTPDPDKIIAIGKMKEPENVTDVRRFLGMANQLSKFTSNLSELTKPLRELLAQRNAFQWGAPQSQAFIAVKDALVRSPVLSLYDPSHKTVVSADASSYGLGAVLRQEQPNGGLQPVAYISRALTQTEERYAQIEKEALALTWACERLSDYLLGLQFHIETDHKPLVSLFGQKSLDELPLRVQRFRMRMMRFSFSISHVPGKDLSIADALSRAPASSPELDDHLLEEEAEAYVQATMAMLPATEKRLEEIKLEQGKDNICKELVSYTRFGWPDKSKLSGIIKKYHSVAAELSVQNGLLVRGSRLVIPVSMQPEILRRVHEGHQGIVKCRERARQSVWWPGMSKQLQEVVLNCRTCCQYRTQKAEPLLPSSLPTLPWQKVGCDLFQWKGLMYLLIIDYYSRWIEIAKLEKTDTSSVIAHTSSIFARHGIPEIVMSDNGPQFSSGLYAEFAKNYGFQHLTSSPLHPQGNGEAERGVKIIKDLLRKAEDPYKALLAYRSTPLEIGFSPSELLMSRRLRTTLPALPELRSPAVPDSVEVLLRDEKAKERQKRDFDSRRGAKELPDLQPGDTVWVTDRSSPAKVSEQLSPRSYSVHTPEGTYRRNRGDLVPYPVVPGTPAVEDGLQEEVERSWRFTY